MPKFMDAYELPFPSVGRPAIRVTAVRVTAKIGGSVEVFLASIGVKEHGGNSTVIPPD